MLQNNDLPQTIDDEAQLDELLSRPTSEVVEMFARLKGDVAFIGGGGKIGPSMIRMASRAKEASGFGGTIYAVSRFSNAAGRAVVERAGAAIVACDLLADGAEARLPDAQNVFYLVGQKFGTTDNPAATWAANTIAPAVVARRYRAGRIVAFSTGCVYDLVPASCAGSTEASPLAGAGEYAASCIARERVLEYFAHAHGTPLALVRLNYAVEMRYGVLVDLALDIFNGRPVDLAMGHFNAMWQGDVNACTLRLLEHAASPPLAINMTGPEKLSVRDVATGMAALMNLPVQFKNAEAGTALLSDASRLHGMLGLPRVGIENVIRWTADWVRRGGALLGKPTHFQTRDGKY